MKKIKLKKWVKKTLIVIIIIIITMQIIFPLFTTKTSYKNNLKNYKCNGNIIKICSGVIHE